MQRGFLVVTGMVLLLLGGCSQESPEEVEKKKPYVMTQSRTVKTESTRDISNLFKDINYSVARWDQGDREIPRVYITDISSRWGTQSQRISTKTKKAIFFQLVLPLILRSNELIVIDRERLLALSEKFPTLDADESAWLQKMAKRYKVNKKADDPVDRQKVDELLLRMNVIPPSLALAQAAEESGWGASRFAMLGNSLFGQWAFSRNAMVPQRQRKELGNYGLARFDTPLDAVKSYMLNLNTHRAYKKLRLKRAELEKRGEKVTGYALAEALDKYSERGYAYVESLHTMMTYNRLDVADDAYLWDKETIFITPAPDPKPKPVKKAEQKPESIDAAAPIALESNQSTATMVAEANQSIKETNSTGQKAEQKPESIDAAAPVAPQSNQSTAAMVVEANQSIKESNSTDP